MDKIADSVRRATAALTVASVSIIGLSLSGDPVRSEREALQAVRELRAIADEAARVVPSVPLDSLEKWAEERFEFFNAEEWDGWGPVMPQGRRVVVTREDPSHIGAYSLPLLNPDLTLDDVLRLERSGVNPLGFMMLMDPWAFTKAVVDELPAGGRCDPCSATGWLGFGGRTLSTEGVRGSRIVAFTDDFPPEAAEPWGDWYIDLRVVWHAQPECPEGCLASARAGFTGSHVYPESPFTGTALQARSDSAIFGQDPVLDVIRSLEHEVGSLTMAQADHYLVRSIHDGSRRLDVLGVSFHDSTVAVGGLALILGLLILLFSNLAALRRAAARAGHGAAWAGPAFEPTRLAQLLSVGLHVALPVTAVVALILWSWPQLPVALRFLSLLLSVAVLAVGIGCEGVAHGFRRLFTDPPASRGTAHNGLP